ncbi:hypothetical protein [Motilimonas eburnea]|uniref:hypothetical protein n=1 Tax=Motilimonas eburnea TaxID=1737488 RepID=UPI001E432999|nr:hypothetical protein [Motilimonas eburnea]MCE2571667.1 hypothetical protein [Motilimonas eburnea]
MQIFAKRLMFWGATIRRLNRSDDHQLNDILRLLDSGISAFDLISKLKNNETSLKELDRNLIIKEMEEHAIMFPVSFDTHPYPFSMMHTIIENPLYVYQPFLMLPPIENLIDIAVINALQPYEDDFMDRPSDQKNLMGSRVLRKRPSHDDRQPLSLERARKIYQYINAIHGSHYWAYIMQLVGDGKISLNKNEFSSAVESDIEGLLKEWAEYVFNSLTPTPEPTGKLFDELLDTSALGSEGLLKVCPATLEHLCMLGQSNHIGELIAHKLESQYMKDKKNSPTFETKGFGCLSQLSKWYKATKTKFNTEPSQIPANIAPALYFHVTESDGLQYVSFGKYDILKGMDKASVQSRQKLVSALIRTYLYFYNPIGHCFLQVDRSDANRLDDTAISVDEYIAQIENGQKTTVYNPLMQAWSDYQEKTARDRFKRPMNEFNKRWGGTLAMIDRQRQASITQPFPVDFPLPLWARKSFK